MNLIHIGANKTASTLLQRKLFSQLENTFFFGEESSSYHNISSSQFINDLIYQNSDDWLSTRSFSVISDKIRLTTQKNKRVIISSEDLISYGIQSLNAERLKFILPDASILLVIRNQMDAILSWYISHGSRLRNVPNSYWQNYVSPEEAINFMYSFPQFTIEKSFNYLSVYQVYAKLYDKCNVHCIPYELLDVEPALFFSTLSNILKVSENKLVTIFSNHRERQRPSPWRLKIHSVLKDYNKLSYFNAIEQILNQFYPLNCENLFSLTIRERIWQKYVLQNRELSSLIGYDLKSLRYPF